MNPYQKSKGTASEKTKQKKAERNRGYLYYDNAENIHPKTGKPIPYVRPPKELS